MPPPVDACEAERNCSHGEPAGDRMIDFLINTTRFELRVEAAQARVGQAPAATPRATRLSTTWARSWPAAHAPSSRSMVS